MSRGKLKPVHKKALSRWHSESSVCEGHAQPCGKIHLKEVVARYTQHDKGSIHDIYVNHMYQNLL